MQGIEEWQRNFQDVRGRDALEKLDSEFSLAGLDAENRLELRQVVLESCYSAATFTRESDPSEDRRLRNTRALSAKRLKSHKKAITKLKDHIRRNPAVTEIAFGHVILSLKLKTSSSTPGAAALLEQILDSYSGALRSSMPFITTPGPAALLDQMLDGYSRALRPSMPLITTGPMLHRSRYGCLLYPKALDGKRNKRPDAATMLLFDLVQLFRLCSESKTFVRRQPGEPMPDEGDPHFPLAAALINATYNEAVLSGGAAADNRLKHFLVDNREIGFLGWPALSAVGSR